MPKRRDPTAASAFSFDGFDSPNTTPVPDVLFDVLAPELAEAELRVLLYIIRRTYGFKKHSDNISLKQLVEGIRTRDGRVLDNGAGVAKSAASRAVQGLTAKGIIFATRNRSPEKGDEPTTYRLRVKGDPAEAAPAREVAAPVFSTSTRGGPPKEHVRVLQENPQETGRQETGRQHSTIRDAAHNDVFAPEMGGGPNPRHHPRPETNTRRRRRPHRRTGDEHLPRLCTPWSSQYLPPQPTVAPRQVETK